MNTTPTTSNLVKVTFFKPVEDWGIIVEMEKREMIIEAEDIYEAYYKAMEEGADPLRNIKYEWL